MLYILSQKQVSSNFLDYLLPLQAALGGEAIPWMADGGRKPQTADR